MAKSASKSSTTKKSAAEAEPQDPNEDIKSCATLSELFDLRPEDTTSLRYKIWVAKGAVLAKEAGIKFGPM